MIKKIVLGLFLASVMQCNGANSKRQIDELVLAKEIAAVKAKLSEYKVSQSLLESTKNVAGVTAMGSFVGALGGVLQILVEKQLLADVSLLASQRSAAEALGVIKFIKVGMSAGFGAATGLLLGTSGCAGSSMPRLSQSKLLLILVVQNLIAAGINIVLDEGIFDYEAQRQRWLMDNAGREGLVVDYEHIDRAIHELNRRETFLAVGNQKNEDRYEPSWQKIVVVSAIAHAISLLFVIPEVIIMNGLRSDLADEKKALEEALKELQNILDKAKYYTDFARILEE